MYNCRQGGFRDLESFLSHVYNCKWLKEAHYWCPTCNREEHFDLNYLQENSIAAHQTGMKKARDVFRLLGCIGRKKNPSLSPTLLGPEELEAGIVFPAKHDLPEMPGPGIMPQSYAGELEGCTGQGELEGSPPGPHELHVSSGYGCFEVPASNMVLVEMPSGRRSYAPKQDIMPTDQSQILPDHPQPPQPNARYSSISPESLPLATRFSPVSAGSEPILSGCSTVLPGSPKLAILDHSTSVIQEPTLDIVIAQAANNSPDTFPPTDDAGSTGSRPRIGCSHVTHDRLATASRTEQSIDCDCSSTVEGHWPQVTPSETESTQSTPKYRSTSGRIDCTTHQRAMFTSHQDLAKSGEEEFRLPGSNSNTSTLVPAHLQKSALEEVNSGMGFNFGYSSSLEINGDEATIPCHAGIPFSAVAGTQATACMLHHLYGMLDDRWKGFVNDWPELSVLMDGLDTSSSFDDGLEALRSCLNGKALTTLPSVFTFVHIGYACAYMCYGNNMCKAWNTLYQNVLQWGEGISEQKDRYRFHKLAELLWSPPHTNPNFPNTILLPRSCSEESLLISNSKNSPVSRISERSSFFSWPPDQAPTAGSPDSQELQPVLRDGDLLECCRRFLDSKSRRELFAMLLS